MAKLGVDLKPMTVRLLHLPEQDDFTNRTRCEREEKVGVMRYALCKCSRFMKRALIEFLYDIHSLCYV